MNKPDYRGRFFGQSTYTEVKVATGQKVLIDKFDEETGEHEKFMMKVMAKSGRCQWTRDGDDWIPQSAFDAKFTRKKEFVPLKPGELRRRVQAKLNRK